MIILFQRKLYRKYTDEESQCDYGCINNSKDILLVSINNQYKNI